MLGPLVAVPVALLEAARRIREPAASLTWISLARWARRRLVGDVDARDRATWTLRTAPRPDRERNRERLREREPPEPPDRERNRERLRPPRVLRQAARVFGSEFALGGDARTSTGSGPHRCRPPRGTASTHQEEMDLLAPTHLFHQRRLLLPIGQIIRGSDSTSRADSEPPPRLSPPPSMPTLTPTPADCLTRPRRARIGSPAVQRVGRPTQTATISRWPGSTSRHRTTPAKP